ncbi:MAG: hypothetical protein R3C53_18925 [Pirellulaceae bacterium]
MLLASQSRYSFSDELHVRSSASQVVRFESNVRRQINKSEVHEFRDEQLILSLAFARLQNGSADQFVSQFAFPGPFRFTLAGINQVAGKNCLPAQKELRKVRAIKKSVLNGYLANPVRYRDQAEFEAFSTFVFVRCEHVADSRFVALPIIVVEAELHSGLLSLGSLNEICSLVPNSRDSVVVVHSHTDAPHYELGECRDFLDGTNVIPDWNIVAKRSKASVESGA